MTTPAAIETRPATRAPLDMKELVGRAAPLVIRQLVADWPIVGAGRTSDTAFATTVAGWCSGSDVDVLLMAVGEGGRVGYNEAMDGFNYEHHKVTITQALQRLAAYSRRPPPTPGLAVQSALIADCVPGFHATHTAPISDATVPPRLWIGNQVTTPAHFDESHNVACVVCGTRRFTLFAPEQLPNLYIGPLDFAPTGAAISMARLDRPDDPRFPRLQEALAHAQVADLQPGDAIYIPPMWWHHVESLGPLNALVNYWWRPLHPGGATAETTLASLLHCILTMKSLPAPERAAWKGLLDYYLFDEHDPAAHIPAQRRGILGPLTPDVAARLRESIRKYF